MVRVEPTSLEAALARVVERTEDEIAFMVARTQSCGEMVDVAGLCKDADGNGWVEGGAHGAKFKWIF
jgi:hypothetical protein